MVFEKCSLFYLSWSVFMRTDVLLFVRSSLSECNLGPPSRSVRFVLTPKLDFRRACRVQVHRQDWRSRFKRTEIDSFQPQQHQSNEESRCLHWRAKLPQGHTVDNRTIAHPISDRHASCQRFNPFQSILRWRHGCAIKTMELQH